uniref:Uncharacterized protein n=1 Tax=Micrurus spixii TaxID=129469 RepID=A0A2D4N0N2_9SAUR
MLIITQELHQHDFHANPLYTIYSSAKITSAIFLGSSNGKEEKQGRKLHFSGKLYLLAILKPISSPLLVCLRSDLLPIRCGEWMRTAVYQLLDNITALCSGSPR